GECRRRGGLDRCAGVAGILCGQAVAASSSAQLADDVVIGHAEQPRGWVVGHAASGPGRHGSQQGGLDRVLDEFEVLHPRSAREHRNEPAVLVPEERFAERQGGHGAWISMTSTPEPGRTSPGQPRAISIASSRLAAETIMYPPTSSLTSTRGPSGTRSAVTSVPRPSLPPRSVRWSWNFWRQSVNFSYIACIWVGEGWSPS